MACLIVAGPTAAGKSALALRLAERFDGTIINADAMQCYRELRILTARPSEADEARIPHRLYGTRAAADPGTAASWRVEALACIEEAHAAGRLPILCGGTFLYLRSLTAGLAEIPHPGQAAREEARALVATEGAGSIHARLAAVDPETAATVRPSDSQRVARAWEVWRGTGRGLRAWQRAGGLPPAPFRFAVIILRPPRAVLREAIERRLNAMLGAGALDEVAALIARQLDPALPAMRAHGVPEFAAHLAGRLTLKEARAATVTAVSRYIRRQETWLRHHDLTKRDQLVTNRTPEADLEQQMQIEAFVSDVLFHGTG